MRKEITNKTTNGNWAEMLLQPFFMDNTINTSDSSQVNDILEARELAEKILKMRKLGTLAKEYPLEKVKHRPDGRCYIYINRKQFIAPTYDALLEKLYDEFYGVKNYTLANIFPEWQIYRRDVEKVSSKTLKDHKGYWDNYMKNSKLVELPITKVSARDVKDFYKSVVSTHDISDGTFKFIRTILNKLFDFAISELEIIQFNPIPSISIKPYQNSFKESKDTFEDVYKKEARAQLLLYLEKHNDDIYSLATQFAFRLIIRFGELSALRWDDIDGEYIYIRHQRVERQVMNDNLTFEPRTMETIGKMKGKKKNGKRKQFLTEQAREILKKVKELNPDGEYIFMNDGRPFNDCTFNRHLRKLCKGAGVEYHSSHKIRFTSASMLYDGTNLAILSQLLGHTNTATTLRYFRNILGEDEVKELMKKLDDIA